MVLDIAKQMQTCKGLLDVEYDVDASDTLFRFEGAFA